MREATVFFADVAQWEIKKIESIFVSSIPMLTKLLLENNDVVLVLLVKSVDQHSGRFGDRQIGQM